MGDTSALTADRLRDVLSYDELTGEFRWRKPTAVCVKVGDRAGGFDDRHRYWKIKLDGRLYSAHRLAWLYVHGEWPAHQIDHINQVKTDNRIANLRDVTSGANTQNASPPRRTNSSGLRGVSRPAGCRRWLATITIDGNFIRLGFFDTPEEAHAVYVAAKRAGHPFWAPAT